MSVIDTLVYDRELAHVLRVQALEDIALTRELTADEIAEWNDAVVRGAYNDSDLNRIGEAIVYADAYLSTVQDAIDDYRASLGVADDPLFDAHILPPEEIVIPRQNYDRTELPIMADDVARTMRAAEILAARVGITFAKIDVSRMTYTAANAVERAIYDAYRNGENAETTRKEAADRIAAGWYFSGDLICGEI